MKFQLLPILFLIYHFAYPQGYEGNPCRSGRSELNTLLQKKELKEWLDGCNVPYENATSFLQASGKAPLKQGDPGFTPPNDAVWGETCGDCIYDRWTCMYSPGKVFDGDKSTAWVEGVPGYGRGELLLVNWLDLSKKIEILAGFGKSPALFIANNRPKTISLYVIRAAGGSGNGAQCETFAYGPISIIASMTLTLRDVNRFQPLPIPAFKKENYTYWLMIELIDVYPGNKYDDTCISEIRNVK